MSVNPSTVPVDEHRRADGLRRPDDERAAASAYPPYGRQNGVGYDDDAFDPSPYDYAPYQPYAQPYSRPPPPAGPPPTYYRVLNRTYAGSLRPIVLFACFLSLCYLILLGVQDVKTSGYKDVSAKYKTLLVVQGVLFFGAAGIEVFGLMSTYSQRLGLARTYSWLSLIAYGATVTSQILSVVVLFTLKTDVIASCTTYYQGNNVDNSGSFWDNNANNTPMTAAQASEYCQHLWSRSRTWDIIWLIVTALVGAIFVMFGFAYAHQLNDPNSVRSKVSANTGRFTNQHTPSGAYQYEGPYDAQAQYAYPPSRGQAGRNAAYPPTSFDAPPPEYKGRLSFDETDIDAKTDGDVDRSRYGYGQAQYDYERSRSISNRPGSSRNVRLAHEDHDENEEDVRRESGETLRGEPASVEAKEEALTQHSSDDGHTPRV